MSKLRTINIDPQFLSISKKKQKSQKSNIPLNEVKLNSNNIRELLLEKLKQHKKNKKTLKNPMVQLNTMDEQISTMPNNVPNNTMSNNHPNNTISDNKEINIDTLTTEIQKLEETPLKNEIIIPQQDTIIKPDKPYGILKNGIKPTYKNWSQDSLNTEPIHTTAPISQMPQENVILKQDTPLIQEIEVKKVFELGRNKKNKTVSVLLKNNNTRKKIETDKVNFKKTNISTVKNFLKKQNLIKFGTTAPNNLLRELYESTKLCGEITNENTKSLIHNFKED